MIQETSLRAYFDIQRTLNLRQKQVFVALSDVKNATNREIQQMTGIPINEVTPRIHELRERHVVVEAEHRKCRISGRTVIAWKSIAPSLPPAFPAKTTEQKQSLF
jgi:hypothetical protein